MIKKNLLFLCMLVSCTQDLHTSSKSFFRPRDISTDSMLELSLTNYHRYHSLDDSLEDGDLKDRWFSFYAKPLFMQSTNHKKMARYFLPNNNACATLDESGNGTLDSLWFNLISPDGTFYNSNIFLAPERTVAGVLFTMYVNFTKAIWLGINSAAVQVTNNIHLHEYRNQTGTIPGFANAYNAFNNSAWCAGKISCADLKVGGLDDIQFKLGYDVFKLEDGHATIYLVATAPTGKRPNSEYLFEPLVGSKNGSVGVGLDLDAVAAEIRDYELSFMLDFKYRFIFPATERRSFDLCKNGQWSRYLLVVTPDQLLNSQPGINLLTIPVKVTPRSTIDLWAALNLPICNFNIEIGYDFWWRQAEKICKKCPICPGYGIQTLALCGFPLSSASTANITQGASGSNATVTDTTFTYITDADLNLNSAAHPHALSQKLYIDFGYTIKRDCYSALLGLGAAYEFATKNALDQWTVWITTGITF